MGGLGPTELGALAAALDAIAPPAVRCGVRLIDVADERSLAPVERSIVAGAVARRRREFASGRALLRQLLGTDEAVTVLVSRAPALPPGVVASLAHDDEVVVAAIASSGEVAALGIDVEAVGSVGADIADDVLRSDERDLDPTLAFVLKEAAYKAWSATGGRILDHHEVRVSVDGHHFSADVVTDGVVLTGRYANAAQRWLALVVELHHHDGP